MSASLAEVPPMVIGGSIISVVSLIFHIIGFSTTYWYILKNEVGVKYGHFGLWQECEPAYGRELCSDITVGQFAQFKATEALECLALLAFVAAVICAFLKMFVLKERGILFVVTGLLNLIAGVIALIGVIVFSMRWTHAGCFQFSLLVLVMHCGWIRRDVLWYHIHPSMEMGEKLRKLQD